MDAFEILGLPRRPWLEADRVRAAFQARARALHPDAATGDAAAFTALNAAYRELERPASRLRRLLGAAPLPSAPPDAAFGFEIGAFLRAADTLLEKWRAAPAPLTRALLIGEMRAARGRGEALAARVDAQVADAERRLRVLDAAWPDAAPEDLAALAVALTFLDRWAAQLRDRTTELAAA